ncbi:hypothetical protein T12_14767 [Trichinella patagoniensis]|uniref:FLYWCH-type domain-containing protein n=1 Tax=Trichinella patagoniensis TaxID=990121 RepID=A0A0V0ZEP6_9BILA|nr:hypothetical protein T12_14767 [Trichinella patagoniensis]
MFQIHYEAGSKMLLGIKLTELNKSIGTVNELFKRKVKTSNAIMSCCCFVSTQRNQQKLVYVGRCYTLKRTNRNDKYWICASSDEIQFVSTQRNQQKLVYRGRCYTLKRTNRNDKCWICASGTRGCPGKLYTNLDATEVIRTGEHAEGCRVDAHAFYHQQQLAAEDPRPVLEIYDELASNVSIRLETAAHFPTWEQTRTTMYYSRSKRYPRLPARRQDLRLTAEQTTTKSGAQFLMYHSPTNDILIFATEDGVRLLAQSNCWCGDGTFKIVPFWYQQLFTLHVFLLLHSKAEELGV